MKKLLLLSVLLSFALTSCVDEGDCYKCELISADGRFGTTEYLPCDTDIDHYIDWLYERGEVSSVQCVLMD